MATPRPSSGSSLAERLVILFLLLAVGVLAWIHFGSGDGPPSAMEAFDLRNPMLSARVGECVEAESTSNPGHVMCIRVVEPGVVVRSREGPEHLGIYDGLRRGRPYLACALRYPPPGTSCSDARDSPTEIELYDLNAFGMPASTEMSLDSIRPRWARRGGRYRFVYEVEFTRYGPGGGRWVHYLDADAPVTGVVLRREAAARSAVHDTVFTELDDCP